MTRSEKTKQIRKELKEHGITSRQVSVRGRNSTYSDAIDVRIKDMTVDYDLVKEVAEKVKYVRKDQFGEPLMGANTFVFVDYDHDTLRKARELYYDKARRIEEEHKGLGAYRGEVLTDQGEYVVIYYPNSENGGLPDIKLKQKVDVFEDKGVTSLDTVINYCANNAHRIAEALAIFDARFGVRV